MRDYYPAAVAGDGCGIVLLRCFCIFGCQSGNSGYEKMVYDRGIVAMHSDG